MLTLSFEIGSMLSSSLLQNELYRISGRVRGTSHRHQGDVIEQSFPINEFI